MSIEILDCLKRKRDICVTCQTTVIQENWYFLKSINTLLAWRLGVANLITVQTLFFLVSRYENLGELCMHLNLNSESAAPGPICNCFQIANLQNCVCEF